MALGCGGCLGLAGGFIVVGSVPVNAGTPLVPVSLWLSMVVGGNHGNRGVLPRARMSDLSVFSPSPGPALLHPGPGRGRLMDLLHPRCAGVDVSKRDAKVCVRIASPGRAGAKSTVTTWSSMTGQILALREHLIEQQVTLVVMEATGDYWKPFYYLLEDAGFELILANPAAVNEILMPGEIELRRQAQRAADGVSIPDETWRQLRELATRVGASLDGI